MQAALTQLGVQNVAAVMKRGASGGTARLNHHQRRSLRVISVTAIVKPQPPRKRGRPPQTLSGKELSECKQAIKRQAFKKFRAMARETPSTQRQAMLVAEEKVCFTSSVRIDRSRRHVLMLILHALIQCACKHEANCSRRGAIASSTASSLPVSSPAADALPSTTSAS